jgi:hypothetical protein
MKRNNIVLLGLVLTAGVFGYAQTRTIVQGKDPNNVVRDMKVTTTGELATPVCTAPAQAVTTVGTSPANCPSSQLSGRRFIVLCVSNENSGSPKVKVRIDGTNPAMGLTEPGDVLTAGSCATYYLASSVTPKCISDTAGTAVTSIECK